MSNASASLAHLPEGVEDARWPSDDHEGWRHADVWAPPLAHDDLALAIADGAGLDRALAQTLPLSARLLAVFYREPERDAAGNLLGVRVAREPFGDAQPVTSELLVADRTAAGVRALRWEWTEESDHARRPVLWTSAAAVTVAPEAVSPLYLPDREPHDDLWAAHEQRAALYEVVREPHSRVVARAELAEYLRELAARYLHLTMASQSPPLAPPAPRASSLHEALWSPRRLGDS